MAKNRVLENSDVLDVAIASKVSGDPAVFGLIPGVCLTDTDTDGKVALATTGVFKLSVKGVDGSGNAAIAAGDKIYFTSGDTPKLNKKDTGVYFGVALEGVNSGATKTIEVAVGVPG